MIKMIIKELRDRRKSLLAYIVGSVLLLWLHVSIFPTIKDSSEAFKQALSTLPKEFLTAFDIEDFSFDTLEKHLSTRHFGFLWPLLAITLALSRAGNYIAGEIERGTLGLSLSRPISRLKLFFAKYAAGILTLVLFVLVSVLGVMPLAELYNIEYDTERWLKLTLMCLLFSASIFSVALAVSAYVNEKAKVYFPLTAVLILMYAIKIVSNIKPSLDWLQYFSVFHYFNVQDILAYDRLPGSSYLVFGGIIVISTWLAARKFNKRDIAV